jgi:hypothetical protein
MMGRVWTLAIVSSSNEALASLYFVLERMHGYGVYAGWMDGIPKSFYRTFVGRYIHITRFCMSIFMDL